MSDYALFNRPSRRIAIAAPRVSILSLAAVLLPLLMVASALLTPHPDMSAAEVYTQAE